MQESIENAAIVDAKRRAKAHARATGESHQRSLEHIARMSGRKDWAAFLSDPVVEDQESAPRWTRGLERLASRNRTASVSLTLSIVVATLVLVNVVLARRAGLVSYEVPFIVWMPFAVLWTAIGIAIAALMLWSCTKAIGRMSTGAVDAPHAWMLVMTVLCIMIGTSFWHSLQDSSAGWGGVLSSMIVLITSWTCSLAMLRTMPIGVRGNSNREGKNGQKRMVRKTRG